MNLRRRGPESDVQSIVEAISTELTSSGRNNGIKLMLHCLKRKFKLVVRRYVFNDIHILQSHNLGPFRQAEDVFLRYAEAQ